MYMDQYDYEDMYTVNKNRFAIASLICGIISIFTFSSVYFPLVLGSLAVIFAFLSRNGTGALHTYSKIGMVLGIICVVGVIALSIFVYINLPKLLQIPEYRDMLQNMLNNFMGEDVDIEKILGLSKYDYLFRF